MVEALTKKDYDNYTYNILSIHSYGEGEVPLPRPWKEYAASREYGNGYQGKAYLNPETHEVVIAHRGTEFGREFWKDAVQADGQLTFNKRNVQFEEGAKDFYEEVRNQFDADKKLQNKDAYNWTQTGHSLGGYHATRLGYDTGQKVVTFDAPPCLEDIKKTNGGQPVDLAETQKRMVNYTPADTTIVSDDAFDKHISRQRPLDFGQNATLDSMRHIPSLTPAAPALQGIGYLSSARNHSSLLFKDALNPAHSPEAEAKNFRDFHAYSMQEQKVGRGGWVAIDGKEYRAAYAPSGKEVIEMAEPTTLYHRTKLGAGERMVLPVKIENGEFPYEADAYDIGVRKQNAADFHAYAEHMRDTYGKDPVEFDGIQYRATRDKDSAPLLEQGRLIPSQKVEMATDWSGKTELREMPAQWIPVKREKIEDVQFGRKIDDYADWQIADKVREREAKHMAEKTVPPHEPQHNATAAIDWERNDVVAYNRSITKGKPAVREPLDLDRDTAFPAMVQLDEPDWERNDVVTEMQKQSALDSKSPPDFTHYQPSKTFAPYKLQEGDTLPQILRDHKLEYETFINQYENRFVNGRVDWFEQKVDLRPGETIYLPDNSPLIIKQQAEFEQATKPSQQKPEPQRQLVNHQESTEPVKGITETTPQENQHIEPQIIKKPQYVYQGLEL